ncbi:MAG TPA: siderophore ABC transporter substrate-binding protein [Limnochordales bacterium]|nr:siderophore ABC transporter substrate-binding protein [Limnochordales bacterium]
MGMKLMRAVLVLVLALGVAGGALAAGHDWAQPMVVRHALGETVLTKQPQRVVVFDFGALDTLDKLGVPVVGLPKQAVPAYLAKYMGDAYANVGSLVEPAFERVYAARPDLIIISTRQQDMYEEFQAIAPTLFLGVDYADYMGSFERNVRLLAAIFGKEEEAEAELAAIRESVDALRAAAAAQGGKALVVLVNEGRISAYGPGSRYGMIHDDFGFGAADEGIVASTHGQTVSFEYVLAKNPDYLFVIDRTAAIGGESSAKAVIENDLIKMTKAYQNGRIVYLDPGAWYLSGGGLVSVAQMVAEVWTALE